MHTHDSRVTRRSFLDIGFCMPIKGRWFQDFAFLDPHNLREISSLTLVESLRIQTVLEGHSIVRVYRLQRKNQVPFFLFQSLFGVTQQF